MRSLPELQREFGAALLGRGSTPPGIEVYRANVFGNCAQALAAAYPVVRKIVGEEFFDAMARLYARRYPSSSGNLNELGARLAHFVAEFEHTQDLPYLPDVARMEWLAHLAYYAPDAQPLDRSALAGLPPESYPALRPRLVPGSALIASDWPLGRIWEVHQDDYRGDARVDLRAGPDRILIFRRDWRAHVRSVSRGEFRFLAGALRGETLGEMLEAAAELDGELESSRALARWLDMGALAL